MRKMYRMTQDRAGPGNSDLRDGETILERGNPRVIERASRDGFSVPEVRSYAF